MAKRQSMIHSFVAFWRSAWQSCTRHAPLPSVQEASVDSTYLLSWTIPTKATSGKNEGQMAFFRDNGGQ